MLLKDLLYIVDNTTYQIFIIHYNDCRIFKFFIEDIYYYGEHTLEASEKNGEIIIGNNLNKFSDDLATIIGARRHYYGYFTTAEDNGLDEGMYYDIIPLITDMEASGYDINITCFVFGDNSDTIKDFLHPYIVEKRMTSEQKTLLTAFASYYLSEDIGFMAVQTGI